MYICIYVDIYKVNKIVGIFVYLVFLLLCACSHTTFGVVITCNSKLVCLRTIGLKNILLDVLK